VRMKLGQPSALEDTVPMQDSPVPSARTPPLNRNMLTPTSPRWAPGVKERPAWAGRAGEEPSDADGAEHESVGLFSTNSGSPNSGGSGGAARSPLTLGGLNASPLTLSKSPRDAVTPTFLAMAGMRPMDVDDSPLSQKTPRRSASADALATSPAKEAEEALRQQLASEAGEELTAAQFEEEACLLLSEARAELSSLNARWKDAQSAAERRAAEVADLTAKLQLHEAGLGAQEQELAETRAEAKRLREAAAAEARRAEAAAAQRDELHARLALALEERAVAEQARLDAGLDEGEDEDCRVYALEARVQALHGELALAREDKDAVWRQNCLLEQWRTDAEQLRVAQRQQLSALVASLEASEAERETLVDKWNEAQATMAALEGEARQAREEGAAGDARAHAALAEVAAVEAEGRARVDAAVADLKRAESARAALEGELAQARLQGARDSDELQLARCVPPPRHSLLVPPPPPPPTPYSHPFPLIAALR
jgi:hypothetical protein